MDTYSSRINIYHQLNQKYHKYLKPSLESISIVQSSESVWLESLETEQTVDGFEKQTIKTIDLSFILDDDAQGVEIRFFNPIDSIENNARKFINEFSPYSIIQTTDLFTGEACDKINKKYLTFGIEK
jgi:hypothetical protein